jgi:RNA polymerase sigma factor (sigma-70 family)
MCTPPADDKVTTMSESSDIALVAAARRGDKVAFSELIQQHRSLLLCLCRRSLRDAELAEDATQEAVLIALTNLDRLQRADRFGPWLAGIGLNVCRRWLREQAVVSLSWEAMQGGRADDWPSPGPGPEERAEAADEARIVHAAIRDLPPGRREAVALYYLADLTQREIAARVDTSLGAVKVRLHEGRAQLRERLGTTERS